MTTVFLFIKKKLLQRESFLKEALKDGPKSFMELNKMLLGDSQINFSPAVESSRAI
jgi:hypothetical protein